MNNKEMEAKASEVTDFVNEYTQIVNYLSNWRSKLETNDSVVVALAVRLNQWKVSKYSRIHHVASIKGETIKTFDWKNGNRAEFDVQTGFSVIGEEETRALSIYPIGFDLHQFSELSKLAAKTIKMRWADVSIDKLWLVEQKLGTKWISENL